MLKFAQTLFSIIGAIADYMERKQLLDAGKAQALKDVLDEQLEKIRKADDARRNANADADSLPDDPNNRD